MQRSNKAVSLLRRRRIKYVDADRNANDNTETFYEWLKYGETPIATWQYIYPLPPSHVPCGGGGDRPRVWCLKREPVVASLVLPAAAARRLFPVPTLPC